MTNILSQSTIDDIQLALQYGAANIPLNFQAYTAISKDLNAYAACHPGSIDSGTLNWFAGAGYVNEELAKPNPTGAFVQGFMISAAQLEGATLNPTIIQNASTVIAETVFNQIIQDVRQSGDIDLGHFSPNRIIANDAGAGLQVIFSAYPGVSLDNAIWGGTLFARTSLDDPTYLSDYNIDVSSNATKDAQAIWQGFVGSLFNVGYQGLLSFENIGINGGPTTNGGVIYLQQLAQGFRQQASQFDWALLNQVDPPMLPAPDDSMSLGSLTPNQAAVCAVAVIDPLVQAFTGDGLSDAEINLPMQYLANSISASLSTVGLEASHLLTAIENTDWALL